MSSVPSFDTLGSKIKELFEQHYVDIGKIKLNLKNKVSPNILVQLDDGEIKLEDSKVTGSISTQFDVPQVCVQATAKLNNNEDLFTEVLVSDKSFLPGFKALFATKVEGQGTGKQSGFIQTAHSGKYHNVSSQVQFPNFELSSSNVLKYANFLIGCSALLNTNSLALEKNELSLGYEPDEDVSVVASCKELKDYNIGIYKKINDNLEKGFLIGYNDKKEISISLALAAAVSPSGIVKAKMKSTGEIGLAYKHTVRPGLKFSLSSLCEVNQIMSGGHKVGMGIELEG